MFVRFWGTRGSLATPGPDTLRYGGNTSCVEVRSAAGTIVVIDCGTGAHGLGRMLMAESNPVNGHLLISHTHWDHIQGIPFFEPLFEPNNQWDIYAPHSLSQSIRDTLAGQMQYTYFPVTIDALGAKIAYHDLVEGVFQVGDITVHSRFLNHPALTLGYRLEVDGVSVVYSCDHEPHTREQLTGSASFGDQDTQHIDFLRSADLVIHDAQYTEAEYPEKIGWGHSTSEYAVEVCKAAGVAQLALTHHDPLRNDDAVDEIVRAMQDKVGSSGETLRVFAAAEGQKIELEPQLGAEPTSNATSVSAETSINPAISEYSILLCSPDDKIADLIKDAAAAEGIRITSEAAKTAMETLLSDPPSLVVVDLDLPRNQLLSLCQRTRELGSRNNMPVPIVLVSDGQDIPSEIVEFGVDNLTRPFSQEYARTRIRAWILRATFRWVRAEMPEDEQGRLATLGKMEILDTPPEERFDTITRMAADALGVPIALLTLVDHDRQWFKSSVGIEVTETPRDSAFCAHSILEDELMIVQDSFLDQRFADNPLVTGDPRVRFYAGCPLKAPDGQTVGTLCLIDTRPRRLDDQQMDALRTYGKMAEQELAKNLS